MRQLDCWPNGRAALHRELGPSLNARLHLPPPPLLAAEATNTRVAWFNILAALICCSLSGWQLWYLNKVRRGHALAGCPLLSTCSRWVLEGSAGFARVQTPPGG